MQVRILKALEEKPVNFSELKTDAEIESSGHLQFHLNKPSGLVGTAAEGSYNLTDDGGEAINVRNSTSTGPGGVAIHAKGPSIGLPGWAKPLIACLMIVVVVLSGVAVYQRQEITTMTGRASTTSSSAQVSTVTSTTTETVFTTVGPYDGLLFISASGLCLAARTAVPCWGTNNPYLFTFSSSCASSEGCNQTVATGPFPSISKYVVNLRFLFTNQTTPVQQNCIWSVKGTTPQQGYAYCVMINPTSFWVGMQGPAPP